MRLEMDRAQDVLAALRDLEASSYAQYVQSVEQEMPRNVQNARKWYNLGIVAALNLAHAQAFRLAGMNDLSRHSPVDSIARWAERESQELRERGTRDGVLGRVQGDSYVMVPPRSESWPWDTCPDCGRAPGVWHTSMCGSLD